MRHVVAILLLALVLLACSDGAIEPAGAGSSRNAPAVFPDAGPNATTEQAEVTELDAGTQDWERTTPPDRILREGAEGVITRVIDGDTVRVTISGWYHRVRIQGINAPECELELRDAPEGSTYICTGDAEWWGYNAYLSMVEIAEGERVTIRCDQAEGEACPQDNFERFLAFLDGVQGDIGQILVREGGAMSFTKFDSTRRASYCLAENAAIEDGVGMWSLGDRDAVLNRMSESTQSWYETRDSRCSAAIGR